MGAGFDFGIVSLLPLAQTSLKKPMHKECGILHSASLATEITL